MPSINLAPGTQYIIQARKRRQRLFIISLILIVVTAIVWIGLYTYQRQLTANLSAVEEEIRNVELKIAELETESDRIILFEKRLTTLDALLNQHVSWDALLGDVERLLPVDTVLTGFNAQAGGGEVRIQAQTSNIDQVALTLASLTASENHDTVFRKATLGGVRRIVTEGDGEGAPEIVTYDFEASLTFDPAVLRNTQ